MKPRVGITPSPSEDQLSHGTFMRYAMAAPYVDAVIAAGGVPIVLPPQDGHSSELLDTIDALLLSGGGDVAPDLFGEEHVHPATYGVSPLRDRFEIDLVRGAIERDLPVLGICRGIQVLNVALGGTLIQHLLDQRRSSDLVHRQNDAGLAPDAIGHEVTITPESLLSRVVDGVTTLGVNSFHHQAIRDLAPSLHPIAFAPDGVIEGVELPDRTFMLGVQWHPELMFVLHPEQLQPFAALVHAAEARRLSAVS